jgi:hypothetical protein
MPEITDDRTRYRKALVHVMAEAARGATILNVWAPPTTPPPARVALGVLGGAGMGGIAAMGVIWRGASGEELTPPLRFSPIERILGEAAASGGTGFVMAAGITRSLARSSVIGGRIAMATAAGAAAAETVRALDDVIARGRVMDEAAETLQELKEKTEERLDRVRELINERIEEIAPDIPKLPAISEMPVFDFISRQVAKFRERKAIEDKNVARVTGNTEAKREATEKVQRVFGLGREIKGAELEALLEASDRAREVARALMRKAQPAPAPKVLQLKSEVPTRKQVSNVKGFWRTRTSPDGRKIREYVRPHSRKI